MTVFSTDETPRSTAALRTKRLTHRLIAHHLVLMIAAVLTVCVLYVTRPSHDAIMKASFSTAYPAFVLLVATLLIGPWNLLRGRRTPVSSDLRRDIGIWAAILGIVHSGIGLFVHLRGRPWLYFIYPRSQHHRFPLRHDLFGFANDTGSIATIILVLLFVTSNDYALRVLGTPRWKQLQRWNYLLFLLALLHAAAYQIIEKQHMPFVLTVVACAGATLLMQALGYQRRRARDISPNQVQV
ncbi:MAG TPA: ferric reductase-like transmembrane domain-containing protein [Acidobacteriaceae bacterium]|nr:ferric reductase-like transmembrane domain-containing protein [Acidobacteriaceae bacterium]